MNTRRRTREIALQVLYHYEMTFQNDWNSLPLGSELLLDISRHFDHFQAPPEAREYATRLVTGTLERREEIDALIEKHASNWKLGRISFVERNLLRMAAYEMLHCPDVDDAVVLNEAVDLAKDFASAEAGAFVNGVLDSIRKAAEPTPEVSSG